MKLYFRSLILSVSVLLTAAGASAQYINTFAGTGDLPGYSGDNNPAIYAQLYGPSDLAFDDTGNLYITDFINQVIRKVDPLGTITTIVGSGLGAGTAGGGGFSGDSGPALLADLNGPFALAIDHSGNIIFADGYNHVVRKVTPAGIITTIAGDHTTAGYFGDGGPAVSSKLNNPVGIAIDKIGNIYIADDHNNVIRKIDTFGVISTVAGNDTAGFAGDHGPATAAELRLPIGVGLDTAGNLYIADSHNNRIRRVDAVTGIITTVAGQDTAGYSGDLGLAVGAALDTPERVNFDDSNNLYISDYYNNVIRKVNAITGVITTVAGNGYGAGSGGTLGGYSGDDSLAVNAMMALPQGVAFDPFHRMYIADRGNSVVRIVGNSPGALAAHNIRVPVTAAFSVYPNPAIGGSFRVLLSSDRAEQAQLTITNVVGETVKTMTVATNKPADVLLAEPAGVYFVAAATSGGRWVKKVIVE